MPSFLPVAYGLKDYKLTNSSLRKATEHVLTECKKRGIRVLTLSTDGQWIQLMVRDRLNNPLTVYELQKDVWESVQKMTKPELVKKISSLNVVHGTQDEIESAITWERASCIESGLTGYALYLTSKDIAFDKINTSSDPRVWNLQKVQKKENSKEIQVDSTESDSVTNTDWLPDDMIVSLQEKPDTEIQTVVSSVAEDIRIGKEQNHYDEMGMTQNQPCDVPLSRNGDLDPEEETSYVLDDQQDLSETERDCIIYNKFIMNGLIEALRNEHKTKKWQKIESKDLQKRLKSKMGLESLTHAEMNIIYSYLYKRLPTTLPEMKVSWKKDKKVNLLSALIGISELEEDMFHKNRRVKTVKSLRQLCMKIIQSKRYPKPVLSVAYSSYIFPQKLSQWQAESPIASNVKVEGFEDDIPFWYSYPELIQSTGELLGKSIDCSHNLTHMRVRTCSTGIGHIRNEGWIACARSNETSLKLPLVEDMIDKQSVPNARTHFSQEVEEWLRRNNFDIAANFAKLVRNWYEASDSPGIPSRERVQHLLNMRHFLLDEVDFGTFPPQRRYINGIPVVTFQGMCIDIDTKLQLYGITYSYNIRSVGSLAAETTVGVLQTLHPVSQVSIKARDVPSLMSSAVEVMTCKINLDRGFHMRTSRLSGIYPEHEDTIISDEQALVTNKEHFDVIVEDITPRDHQFDKPERKKVARKIKFGSVSHPLEPSRGALGVRQWHRRDESKILPTKRLGINLELVDV